MSKTNAQYQARYRARQTARQAAFVKLAETVRDELANATGEKGKRLHAMAVEALS